MCSAPNRQDMNEKVNTTAIELSVVIPVYKSSGCLPDLLRQLVLQLDEIGRTYEIILVDDDSPDDSWRVVKELVLQYPEIRAIQLMRNGGQARATLCGFAHAQGDIIVTMDDDLQHRPDQLPKLLDVLESRPDLDCVFGAYMKKLHSGYRNLGSRIIRQINARAFGLPKDIQSSSFRVMKHSVAEAILAHHTENPVISALLYDSTHRVVSIPVEHAPRHSGHSNYTLAKQMRLAVDNICTVSTFPLRAMSALGIWICLLSIVFVCVVLVRYLFGQISVAGWTTVVILVSFFSGIILLSLGVIGEYMVRILREARGFPRYIERERIGFVAPDRNRDGNRVQTEQRTTVAQRIPR